MSNLELITLGPLLAALVLSLVPPTDLPTRSSLSTFFQISWLIFIIALGFRGTLDKTHVGLLLTQTIVLTGVRVRKNTASLLPPMFWFLISLSTAAILCSNPAILLLLAYSYVAFLMFVVSQTGGLYKGSATYETYLFFLLIDLSAFFALGLPYAWTYWILVLPGLARILFSLSAPFSRSLFINCPTDIMLLILGGLVPIGISWLLLFQHICPQPEFLEIVCFGGSFFAAILFFIERSRRQRGIYLFMTQSALSAQLLLGHRSQLGAILCIAALINTALWLYTLEYPKVRIFNIALASITLFFLVYQP